MLFLLFEKFGNLFVGFVERFNDRIIGILLLLHGSLLDVVILPLLSQLLLKLTDHLKIGIGNFLIIIPDFLVFLGHFLRQFGDCGVFAVSDLLGLKLSQIFLFVSQHLHFVLVLLVDLITDPLKVLPQLRLLLHFVPIESI